MRMQPVLTQKGHSHVPAILAIQATARNVMGLMNVLQLTIITVSLMLPVPILMVHLLVPAIPAGKVLVKLVKILMNVLQLTIITAILMPLVPILMVHIFASAMPVGKVLVKFVKMLMNVIHLTIITVMLMPPVPILMVLLLVLVMKIILVMVRHVKRLVKCLKKPALALQALSARMVMMDPTAAYAQKASIILMMFVRISMNVMEQTTVLILKIALIPMDHIHAIVRMDTKKIRMMNASIKMSVMTIPVLISKHVITQSGLTLALVMPVMKPIPTKVQMLRIPALILTNVLTILVLKMAKNVRIPSEVTTANVNQAGTLILTKQPRVIHHVSDVTSQAR